MNEAGSDQKYRPRRLKPADLVQGSLDLLVLRVLSEKSLKQSKIHSEIELLSGSRFNPSRSSLITALQRLLEKGCVEANLKKSKTGHLTHYKRTSAGKELLAKCRKDWRRAIDGIEPFLEPDLNFANLGQAWDTFRRAVAILRRHPAKASFSNAWKSLLEQLDILEHLENELKKDWQKPMSPRDGLRKLEPLVPFGSDHDQEDA